MNDNNDPQSNVAFNTNPETQAGTNPFTGDLKGEFSSDFGTNTNAVSQIFKSNSFASENRMKYLAIGAIVVVAALAGFYVMTDPGSDSFEDEFADELSEEAAPTEDGEEDALAEGEEGATDDAELAEEAADEQANDELEGGVEQDAAASGSSGAFTLLSPQNGARRPYDETNAPAEFTWEGPADRINFSRNSSMAPLVKSVSLNGASFYALENPYPGTWYWQVVNGDGASEVRMFRVSAPERRSFPISQPTEGGNIAGTGGVVSWQAGEKIARYSVEVVASGASFAQPQHRFGTSGTSVALQGVSAGTYDMRVGAFSEVSGRWEWQYIRNVTVQ